MPGRALTVLEITAVASDSVLARVVTVLGGRGARIRELQCRTRGSVGTVGGTHIWCLVETAAGRSGGLAVAVSRVVDVTAVETRSARLSALAQ